MSTEDRYSRKFAFGPLERRGIAGGLRLSQLLLLAAGGVVAIVAFQVGSGGAGLAVGLLTVAASALLAFLPYRGRALEEWVPIAFRYARAKSATRGEWRSAQPSVGSIAALDGSGARQTVDLPDSLAGCELLTVDVGRDRQMGVLADPMHQTLTAVLAVRVRAFGLLSEPEQERRLERWGQALASLARAGSLIRRVQILERTVPADGDLLHRYLAEARDRDLSPDSLPKRSYEALLEGAGFITQDHELFLAVQIDEQRASSRMGRLARERHSDARAAACAGLVREVETFAARLDPADVVVEGALSPRMLARAIRLAFDPYGRERANRYAAALGETDPEPTSFGPLATSESWDRYRTDSAVHRTYWIAQWPRLLVAPTFLAPLLLSADVVRSLSVVLEPVSPERARRAVEAAITSDLADEELRAERGFRTTARRRRRSEAAVRREQELAAGHQEFRFAAYLTVTGAHDEDLELACEQVEQAAHQAYLDVQPLWGEQAAGFTFGALPVARGLRPEHLLGGLL